VLSGGFHEFGHAAAARYSGAEPGAMGAGLYLVWPAFYTDVTDSYRLGRAGRVRTDLGGLYFNALVVVLTFAWWYYSGWEALLLLVATQIMQMIQQLLPLLRFDGYYVLTDLTGVPDILSRIKPIFRSLVRGRKREPQVAELKPWVRVVVTAYLVTLVPTLVFLFAWMMMSAPRLLATVHDSFGLQLDRLAASAGFAEAGVGVVRMLALLMPVAAISLSLGRVTRMTGRGLVRWSRGSLPRRFVAAGIATALVAAVGYIWWPNGDYEPIRPGERGTIGEAGRAMTKAPGGRPFFTPARELEYGPVPTEREVQARERIGGEEPLEAPAPETAPRESRPGASDDPPPNPLDQSEGLGVQGTPSPSGSEPTQSYGPSQPAPSGTTTQPGGTTSPQPAPGDGATTTTEPAPPPSGDTTTTPSEPAPTTTETTPTEPPPESTETTPTVPAPDGADTTSTTTPLPEAESTTTTSPETTTTSPIP
jgi:putative peptide zinc metalloprotease protein